MNRQGRPTGPSVSTGETAGATWTGNRALALDEKLLFELDGWGRTGAAPASTCRKRSCRPTVSVA
jgi:hypothetical protein